MTKLRRNGGRLVLTNTTSCGEVEWKITVTRETSSTARIYGFGKKTISLGNPSLGCNANDLHDHVCRIPPEFVCFWNFYLCSDADVLAYVWSIQFGLDRKPTWFSCASHSQTLGSHRRIKPTSSLDVIVTNTIPLRFTKEDLSPSLLISTITYSMWSSGVSPFSLVQRHIAQLCA